MPQSLLISTRLRTSIPARDATDAVRTLLHYACLAQTLAARPEMQRAFSRIADKAGLLKLARVLRRALQKAGRATLQKEDFDIRFHQPTVRKAITDHLTRFLAGGIPQAKLHIVWWLPQYLVDEFNIWVGRKAGLKVTVNRSLRQLGGPVISGRKRKEEAVIRRCAIYVALAFGDGSERELAPKYKMTQPGVSRALRWCVKHLGLPPVTLPHTTRYGRKSSAK
jgi:hypothetical protein